jgi:hypothetical protein
MLFHINRFAMPIKAQTTPKTINRMLVVFPTLKVAIHIIPPSSINAPPIKNKSQVKFVKYCAFRAA